jgi:hypothetical protein
LVGLKEVGTLKPLPNLFFSWLAKDGGLNGEEKPTILVFAEK